MSGNKLTASHDELRRCRVPCWTDAARAILRIAKGLLKAELKLMSDPGTADREYMTLTF